MHVACVFVPELHQQSFLFSYGLPVPPGRTASPTSRENRPLSRRTYSLTQCPSSPSVAASVTTRKGVNQRISPRRPISWHDHLFIPNRTSSSASSPSSSASSVYSCSYPYHTTSWTPASTSFLARKQLQQWFLNLSHASDTPIYPQALSPPKRGICKYASQVPEPPCS